MKYRDLVSVIVPIYNVERYLNICIESIINQTYKDLEIILVDDGSKDSCPDICEEWKKKDSRIKVIHKENGGLSDARNFGIEAANGDFFIFVDSDDYLDLKFIEILLNLIKVNCTEIAQCGFKKISDNKEILETVNYKNDGVKSNIEMIKDLNNGHHVDNIVVWNKMYSAKLFKDIRFPYGKINEDEFTTYKLLYNSTKISIISESLYYYRENPNSIMRQKYNLKRLDCLQAYLERKEFFLERKLYDIYAYTIDLYLAELRNAYINLKKYLPELEDKRNELLLEYKKNYSIIRNNNLISIRQKMKDFIFCFFPNILYIIKKNKM